MLEAGVPFSVVATIMGWSARARQCARQSGTDTSGTVLNASPLKRFVSQSSHFLEPRGHKMGHSLEACRELLALTNWKVWLPGLDSN